MKRANSYRLNIKPLSVNSRSCVSNGRIVKTREFKNYCDDLQLILPTKRNELPEKILLQILVGMSNPRSDLDNIIKPFQDALQIKYGFNDYRISRIEAEKVVVDRGEEFIEFCMSEHKVKK